VHDQVFFTLYFGVCYNTQNTLLVTALTVGLSLGCHCISKSCLVCKTDCV